MPLPTQPYKGARDFYPEDKRLQKYLFNKMRTVVEKFGYEEYDAPLLEPLELYLAKTGDEIVNEQTYAFTDRGGRQVVIRPEMTPSVSRMVAAKRQELAYPLRWYSIPNLWRYERPQHGRLREHWQLNVDVFGLESLGAEHEVIMIADGIMQAFGAKRDMYTIRVNSRKLMNLVMHDYLNLDEVQAQTLGKLIDHMHKMEHAAFVAEADAVFSPSQRDQGMSDKLLEILGITSLDELPHRITRHQAARELKELIDALNGSKITNLKFDITLMRGFDYYTGTVFEIFDNNPRNNRSMFGGGRYDGLVGLFGVEPVPTVGFGVGDVTFANFLEAHGLLPAPKTETDLYVVLIGDVYQGAQPILASLREMGLRVAVDVGGRKADKQIKTAVKKGIHYALFIGEQELADAQYNLKNLVGGDEEKHGLERIVSIVKDQRNN